MPVWHAFFLFYVPPNPHFCEGFFMISSLLVGGKRLLSVL